MKDFTLDAYKILLRVLKSNGYMFQTVSVFAKHLSHQSVALRHDVDSKPGNALRMASIEAGSGVVATYYFRMSGPAFAKQTIRKISLMGHEIGYHYENLSTVAAEGGNLSRNRLLEKAQADFIENLNKLRELAPVTTICMHGSPLSRLDNRDLWSVCDYRDFGIECEPYLDIDFSKVFYLTDTGRRWDGDRVSVRDRVDRKDRKWPVYRTTHDIVAAIEGGTFPDRSMLTIHPQRWTNNPFRWMSELVLQRVKNIGKRVLVRGVRSKQEENQGLTNE